MLKTSCHCGVVQVEVARRPTSLTECNCSICRRVGARWAYYSRKSLKSRRPPILFARTISLLRSLPPLRLRRPLETDRPPRRDRQDGRQHAPDRRSGRPRQYQRSEVRRRQNLACPRNSHPRPAWVVEKRLSHGRTHRQGPEAGARSDGGHARGHGGGRAHRRGRNWRLPGI